MAEENQEQISGDEQIGYHKGCISTLIKERDELVKMVKVVEQIMQAHMGALQELGVNFETQAAPEENQEKKNVKIEDLI